MITNTDSKIIEHKIHTINNKIDLFQERLEHFPTNVRGDFTTVLRDLKRKREKLKNKFVRLKEASDLVSEDLQTGVEMAWDDLNMAYDHAKERLIKEAS